MLKTQITGAKYLSPQTNQMTNLNIAVPADSKDTLFGTSDILLAKDVVAYLNALDSDISKELTTQTDKIDKINESIKQLVDHNLIKIVTELPTTDIDKNCVYLVPNKNGEGNNVFIEYIYVEESNTFEEVGRIQANVDLSDYYTKEETDNLILIALTTKANASDVLLKKNASGGYYIEENSNELGLGAFATSSMCTASGMFAYAECAATASGTGAHAEGDSTKASGQCSHAEGSGTEASGENSHAEGSGTIASGYCSHAQGSGTKASESYSYAEGVVTIASGYCSHAQGNDTKASGDYSHAEGVETLASGNVAHAEGNRTIASGYCSHAQGINNIEDENAIHSVGIGDSRTRRNAEYIYFKNYESGTLQIDDPKNGYKYLIGVGGYDGISTDNTTYKSVQEVIADLTARIEQLETKVRALEAANTPA